MQYKFQVLSEILDQLKLKPATGPLPFLRKGDIEGSPYARPVMEIYEALGGIRPSPPIHPGGWHMEYHGLAIQLDDAKHFNRYRTLTLRHPIYSGLGGFNLEKYKKYCRQKERECLKAARQEPYWNDARFTRYFGESDEYPVIGQKGVAGWKFQAFRDFLQDLAPLFYPIKVMRLSIWDEMMIEGEIVTLGQILLHQDAVQVEGLLRNIQRRMILLSK